MTSEGKKAKQDEQMLEAIEQAKKLNEYRTAMGRRGFDYQERWHGWGSPVGLSLGFAITALGLVFISIAWSNLFH